ncbi:MAG: glycosyltransferase family 2 protein [Anaerolineaceae bacterium]|nr:glycosyltransferase family 2 protein [Anaerolineaceae bacterium]
MPKVSIIVPCYNEQPTIRLLLTAIHQQTFPLDEMEVIIADGMSTDQTRQEINEFQEQYPDLRIRIVDNPQRIIPAALNRALEAAAGEVIVRLDAHSMPDKMYVTHSVAGLEAGLGDNVGGVWDIQPGKKGWAAESIAAAAAHPLGVGGALYRYATVASEVDTVPFGAFRRSLLDQIGMFDETLLTNEDYEFNTRIRQNGGKIWLNPQIRSVYFARETYGKLARQYFRYGYWKWRMLKRYPVTLRWRQALPPAFVLSLFALVVLSLFWRPAGILLGLEFLGYGLILVFGTGSLALKRKKVYYLVSVPLAIAVMHFCWGAGFLTSIFHTPSKS